MALSSWRLCDIPLTEERRVVRVLCLLVDLVCVHVHLFLCVCVCGFISASERMSL